MPQLDIGDPGIGMRHRPGDAFVIQFVIGFQKYLRIGVDVIAFVGLS